MKTKAIEFTKNSEGQYQSDIVLPGRINAYVVLSGPGSVEAAAVVEGINDPVEVGESDYKLSHVLDINLIAGTTIRLLSTREVTEAAYISEEE